jgi:membrane protein YdbS with pleckstrin-like domain
MAGEGGHLIGLAVDMLEFLKFENRTPRSKDMYCNKCGQALPEGSRFCNSCGAAAPAAVSAAATPSSMTGYRSLEVEEEQEVFRLRPTLLFVLIRYAIASLVVLAMAALLGWLRWKGYVTDQVALLILLGFGLLAFAMPVYQHILRRREVYTLTNHKLEMRYGLIAKQLRNIPLDKIQDVTVTASVWQRFFRLGDIVIDSASESGKIHLDDIHNPERYADMILAALRRRN